MFAIDIVSFTFTNVTPKCLIERISESWPCLVAKTKIPKKNPAPAWRLKSRRNKKRIATAVCKWRDESNEPNYAVIRC